MVKSACPLPLFDSAQHLDDIDISLLQNEHFTLSDFQKAQAFLKCYIGSQGTFNSYRREIERLLHWSWVIAKKSLKDLKREDIESFVRFCHKPPKSWIGVKKLPRYVVKDAKRMPNPEWRPFVATVSKAAHRNGQTPDPSDFALSQGAIKEVFAILSSFYLYLLQDEYVYMNPVALIRQKSKFIRKQQGPIKIRRLSERQWKYVIHIANEMADQDPNQHERTLFIMSALYLMYLRISELAASDRWIPTMKDFYRDSEERWWFTTVGKGNKQRQIAVSGDMLSALKRWRKHLHLTLLPSPSDNTPLLPKTRGKGPMVSTNHIRTIVQECFDKAIQKLNRDNLREEADSLLEATVHWLRHTGISDDVKRRPREHVRDDAGHGSSAITDKYIDIELKERHKSAQFKQIVED